jgi:hypothetical protein
MGGLLLPVVVRYPLIKNSVHSIIKGLPMNKIWVGCFLTSLSAIRYGAGAVIAGGATGANGAAAKGDGARAASAEAEIKTLKGQQQATTVARAAPATPRLQLNDNGELKFYGDVEFNLDGASAPAA